MKLNTPIVFLIIVAILAGFGLLFVNNYRNKTLIPSKKEIPLLSVKEKVTLDLYLEP